MTKNDLIVKLDPHSPERKRFVLKSYPELTDRYLENFRPNPHDNMMGNYFLERGKMSGLTGGTGIGKSVLAQQIACSLSLGVSVLGTIPVGRPCKVLLVQAENDARILKANRRGMKENFKVKGFPNLCIHQVRGVNDREFFEALEILLLHHKPDVVIVDPYQNYIGDADINSFEDAQAWTRRMEKLLTRYKFALLLLFHTGKLKEANDGSATYQGSYQLAGTSKISNWLRGSCELMLSKKADKGQPSTYLWVFSKPSASTGVLDNGHPVSSFRVTQSASAGSPFWSLPVMSPTTCSPENAEMSANIDTRVLEYLDKHCEGGVFPRKKQMETDPRIKEVFMGLKKTAIYDRLRGMESRRILERDGRNRYRRWSGRNEVGAAGVGEGNDSGPVVGCQRQSAPSKSGGKTK